MTKSEFKFDITKLSPELEAKFPEEVRIFREFWFSLKQKDRDRFLQKALLEVKEQEETPEWVRVIREIKQKVATENQKLPKKGSDTKYCYECGAKIGRVAKYCENCGRKQPEIQ
jgi:predicted nuclease with TOPRIM domain